MFEQLEVAGWRFAIGELPSESLPRIAADALVAGSDSPALRELAGQSASDVRDSEDLFLTALDELGLSTSSEPAAAMALTRHVVDAIVTGSCSPGVGAEWIWRNTYQRVEEEGDLRIFVGLASELQDHPENRFTIERHIVAAAAEFLSREKPRRWIKLMAVRGRDPLTRSGPDGPIPIGAQSLEITPELQADLDEWARDLDRTYADRPEESGFTGEAEAQKSVTRGASLVERLQSELGDQWHVEYMPQPTRPPGVRLRTK